MNTKNENSEMVQLTPAEIANHQKQAEQDLKALCQKVSATGTPTEIDNLYPYGGTFSIAGIGYLRLFSVTPMEFTNGHKLSFSGEGGGMVFGGGIFAGGGIFSVDPRSLIDKDVTFAVAAGPGIGSPLVITFFLNHLPIGSFSGVGVSAFAGFGGGGGRMTRG